MKINKITPQGYCGGVKMALDILYKSLNDKNVAKPITLLGSIIHNKHVINDLISRGVILVEDRSKTRYELLDEVNTGSVVFSAHGVEPRVYQKALDKGLNIIDTTCKNVLIVQNRIKEMLLNGYNCLYIGTKNHPECEGILGISKDIILISSLDDIKEFKNNKIYVTNQTTLSIYQVKEIYDRIKELYPDAIIDNKICTATTLRQKAVLLQEPTDLCIVVGDTHSSNTKNLVKASESIGIKTILVDSVDELKKYDFININSVSITAGASTPENIINEIITFLSKK